MFLKTLLSLDRGRATPLPLPTQLSCVTHNTFYFHFEWEEKRRCKKLRLDQGKLCCSICLDLLKDPVTIPCGHSFCMSCVESRWSEEERKKTYSCPYCRQMFTPRPLPVESSTFADLTEELKRTGLRSAPPDDCYATTEDVACDFCTGRKRKSLKSCLVCRVSYCQLHLQPHYESPAFRKHKLVEPSKNLAENICSRHDEVIKIFCRTDGQSICFLCSVDEHKGHDTISASAERSTRQRELGLVQEKIQQGIQGREKDIAGLQHELEAINDSADRAVKDSEQIFTELVSHIEKRSSDVKDQIRSQQKAEVIRVKELQEKLEQEIAELRRKHSELEQLLHIVDHTQFFHKYPSLSHLVEPPELESINIQLLKYFEDVSVAVSETRQRLQSVLTEEWIKITQKVNEVDVLLPQPEPNTRAEFLKYSRQIALDPNTVSTGLLLSERNRKVTAVREKQLHSEHPDRFTDWLQVLSRERLTGRCYWEVEMSKGGVSVAVSYKDISRTGNESGFGNNDKSWALNCFDTSYYFRHNNMRTFISGPQSSKVGVYLDHRAGTLSFFSVSDTMTLLHRIQHGFTEPLYAGFLVYWAGDTAELCELK